MADPFAVEQPSPVTTALPWLYAYTGDVTDPGALYSEEHWFKPALW